MDNVVSITCLIISTITCYLQLISIVYILLSLLLSVCGFEFLLNFLLYTRNLCISLHITKKRDYN